MAVTLSELRLELEIRRVLKRMEELFGEVTSEIEITHKSVKRNDITGFWWAELTGVIDDGRKFVFHFNFSEGWGIVYCSSPANEELIPLFTQLFGFPPAVRYRLKERPANERAYRYDYDQGRAEYCAAYLVRRGVAYEVERC